MMPLSQLFPPPEVASKIAIAIGIGLLVGLEREWAQKDVGVRTFAITSLLGMLGTLIGREFALATVFGTFLLVIYINLRSVLVDRTIEITTSASLLVVNLLGILVGEGHWFTPIASAVIVTMLLAWKTEFTRFAGGLTTQEVRSAVLLGLLGFVIYPILPNYPIDKWGLFNPREAWVTVVALAGIGFVSYVFLRIYSSRGLYYAAILGGLVNSTAAASEVSRWITPVEENSIWFAVGLILLTPIAMFVRNLAILLIFAPSAAAIAIWPLLCMAVLTAVIAWVGYRRSQARNPELKLSSPVSLKRVLSMGIVFVIIQITSELAQRHTGHLGFFVISFIGGLVSSASTTASAALIASHGGISPGVAGTAVVITSISSALSNLPLIYQQTHHKGLSRTVALISVAVILFGVTVLLLLQRFLGLTTGRHL